MRLLSIVLSTTLLAFLVTKVLAVTYPEIQSDPFETMVGDYKEGIPLDLEKAINEKFGITMQGFNNQQLTWVWELFNKISQTKFNQNTKGAIIKQTPEPNEYSAQVGCNNHSLDYLSPKGYGVELFPHTDGNRFKLTILHELGHVIWHCNGSTSKQWQKDFEAVLANEETVSAYASNPGCTIGFKEDNLQGRKLSEDFAETVAYYLIQDVAERPIKNCPQNSSPPFEGVNHPMHKQFIKNILG